MLHHEDPPPRKPRRRFATAWGLTLLLVFAAGLESNGVRAADDEATHPGLELLLHEPLSLAAFTTDELARLWTVWEGDARAAAETASVDERRRMTYARYGLIERGAELSDSPSEARLPLGYAVDDRGNLVPNCLSCHGGTVAGRVIPGIANTQQDLTALVGDLLELRQQGGNATSPARSILSLFPLNFTRGSTNATMYSILLGSFRDENLDLVFPPTVSQPYVHNTIDAPAWWLYKKKSRIYWDGMAPKSTRTLMQFTMAPGLTGETIRGWQDEFEEIQAYIESIEAPAYPFDVDEQLAREGRAAFQRVCSECHGTYGARETYPNRNVPLALVGTDPVRHGAIRPESKAKYNRSWFADYGEHPVLVDTPGYVAPPLDGVWATAPYLHNGSVPTLWHVLNPDERPPLWRTTSFDGYDEERMGLVVEELPSVPEGLDDREQRQIYDTSRASQSSAGHRFPEALTLEERRAVLEYLKTL